MGKRTSGITKRQHGFSDAVLDAWKSGDSMALRLALRLGPWLPDPHEVSENFTPPAEDAAGYWGPDYREAYLEMQQLRRDLIEAAGSAPSPKENIDGDY